MITVRELIEVLGDADPDSYVHVALDLAGADLDCVTFHWLQEVHPGAAELVVYGAWEAKDAPDWFASAVAEPAAANRASTFL